MDPLVISAATLLIGWNLAVTALCAVILPLTWRRTSVAAAIVRDFGQGVGDRAVEAVQGLLDEQERAYSMIRDQASELLERAQEARGRAEGAVARQKRRGNGGAQQPMDRDAYRRHLEAGGALIPEMEAQVAGRG